MKDVYYTPDSLEPADLFDHISHIKEDRTAEDLLFQVMLDWGVDLALPIEHKMIDGCSTYFVGGNSLIACFERFTPAVIDEIAQHQPLRVVSCESAIEYDHDKTNIVQRFKQLSPETEVKFL